MAFFIPSASSIFTQDRVWRSNSMHFPHNYLVIFTDQNACLIACGAQEDNQQPYREPQGECPSRRGESETTLLDLERNSLNIMSHACDKLQNLRYLYFSNNISSVWEDSFLGFGESLRALSLIRVFLRATVRMSRSSPTSTLSTTTLPPLPGGWFYWNTEKTPGGAHIQEKS